MGVRGPPERRAPTSGALTRDLAPIKVSYTTLCHTLVLLFSSTWHRKKFPCSLVCLLVNSLPP